LNGSITVKFASQDWLLLDMDSNPGILVYRAESIRSFWYRSPKTLQNA